MNLINLEKIFDNEPAYRLKQAKQAIFHNLISDWSQATTLPPALREKLNIDCPLEIKAEISTDKVEHSCKALLTLNDGLQIETVLMKHSPGRNTICVSSQVGCPLSCAFCATGKMGLCRNLTSEEIIEQVLFFARYLKKSDEKINNLVFMGMGEPFLNYDNVLAAIKLINEPAGFNIGSRHISISTAGIVPGIKKMAKESLQVNLAWSLHAPNDRIRAEMMPIDHQYPIAAVLKAINEYITITNRKVMLEYLMIDGLNDTPELAYELADLVGKIEKKLAFVNLITYNPTGVYQPSQTENIKKFKDILIKNGVQTLQRYKFGADIQAACGQLATNRRAAKR